MIPWGRAHLPRNRSMRVFLSVGEDFNSVGWEFLHTEPFPDYSRALRFVRAD